MRRNAQTGSRGRPIVSIPALGRPNPGALRRIRRRNHSAALPAGSSPPGVDPMNRFDSFLKAPTWFSGLLLAILVAACSQVGSDQNAGQTAALSSEPPRGTEQSFAVLGGSTVTNTGTSVITGNLGVNPGTAVTGFPPGIVTGVTHAADAESLQAQTDTTVMYDNVAGQACTSDLTGQDLGGKSLVPGVYCFSSSAGLTGQLTLDAAGVADAVWVFQTASTLTTASNSSVLLINGANPCNVFWKVGSS